MYGPKTVFYWVYVRLKLLLELALVSSSLCPVVSTRYRVSVRFSDGARATSFPLPVFSVCGLYVTKTLYFRSVQ
jgi:hypothetical protein